MMPSNMIYSLLNVGRIIAGPGSLSTIQEIPATYGAQKVLIITDQGVWNAGLIEEPKNILESAGVRVAVIHDTLPEPTVGQVTELFRQAKNRLRAQLKLKYPARQQQRLLNAFSVYRHSKLCIYFWFYC